MYIYIYMDRIGDLAVRFDLQCLRPPSLVVAAAENPHRKP